MTETEKHKIINHFLDKFDFSGLERVKALNDINKIVERKSDTNEDLIERIERIPTKQVDSPVNFHIRNYARSDEYIPKKYVLEAIRQQ